MWDDATGTVWSHLDGVALDGDLAGEQLQILPLQTTTWAAWLADHPDTDIRASRPATATAAAAASAAPASAAPSATPSTVSTRACPTTSC